MSALTIPVVRSWRTEVLDTAASDLAQISEAMDVQVSRLRRSLERALEDADGRWSVSAAERASEEARTGARLAAAVDDAQSALRAGAADLGSARRVLLDRIDTARTAGFSVADDGAVTAPTLPPVVSAPEDAAAALAERNERQRLLNNQAIAIATEIASALAAVETTDALVASKLNDISVPQTLLSAVDAYLERAASTGDLLEALGKAGAGAAALALTLKNALQIFGKTSALASFLRASAAPITDYAALLRNFSAADDALNVFMRGQANGGFARFLMGSQAARLAGKAFLPLTIASGLFDGITGGGHDGARGWATRGFGLAGAAGAGTLIAASAGLVALGPVGVGIAAAAVIGYGAWTAGNFIYDHWDDIQDFGSAASDWVGDRLHDASDAVNSAKDWAGDRLSDAGGSIVDAGKTTVSTLSFGLLG